MILIDTSCWIQFLRRRGDAEIKSRVAGYIDLEQAAYCAPVQFELIAGARDQELVHVREALRFSALLDFPLSCWELAGELERALRKKRLTIPRDDIFVASAAIHHNVPLYARDKHFEFIRESIARELRLVEKCCEGKSSPSS